VKLYDEDGVDGPWEREMRKPIKLQRQVNGYYIMGRYTSCAWFKSREDAEKECKRMNYRGGYVYRVEPSYSR
jgi:hypothetical protein